MREGARALVTTFFFQREADAAGKNGGYVIGERWFLQQEDLRTRKEGMEE